MATIRFYYLSVSSSVRLAGLFFGFLFLSACQTSKPPEEVTTLFWQALAQGQLAQARTQATQKTQHLVTQQDIDPLSTITTGKPVEDNDNARVPTTILRNKQLIAFDTVLQREDDAWKVNYLQTQLNITMSPLGDVAKSLMELGSTFAQQLERQLPSIQKEMESLGLELKRQIDEFNRALKIRPKPANPPANGRQI